MSWFLLQANPAEVNCERGHMLGCHRGFSQCSLRHCCSWGDWWEICRHLLSHTSCMSAVNTSSTGLLVSEPPACHVRSLHNNCSSQHLTSCMPFTFSHNFGCLHIILPASVVDTWGTRPSWLKLLWQRLVQRQPPKGCECCLSRWKSGRHQMRLWRFPFHRCSLEVLCFSIELLSQNGSSKAEMLFSTVIFSGNRVLFCWEQKDVGQGKALFSVPLVAHNKIIAGGFIGFSVLCWSFSHHK